MGLIVALLIAYYALTVLSYWVPLIGFRYFRKPLQVEKPDSEAMSWPYLVAVAPTRSASESIAGMVKALERQEYPRERFQIMIVVDPEGPDDPSARIAEAAGAGVLERVNAEVRTKGAGLNELLHTMKKDPWDALIVLDIDARVDPLFFQKIAGHLRHGAQILQGASWGKNARLTGVARLGDAGQELAGLMQQGRTALGLSAVLSGTGMVFSRSALEVLAWQTSTGRHTSDDGELNLRCALNDLPITYAPDLVLWNDLPEDVRAVRMQRRRWMAAYAELIPVYLGPLLRKAIKGRWRLLEIIFYIFFLPSSSLSLVCAGAATLILAFAAWHGHFWRPWFVLTALLFLLHLFYYQVALRTIQFRWSWKDFSRVPAFVMVRALAIWDGLVLACSANPGIRATPASHGDDRSSISDMKGASS